MSVLEQVMDLKSRGVSEAEIIRSLHDQGISPKAINDALSQAQIKNAVSSEENSMGNENMQPSIMMPERADELPTQGTEFDVEDLTPPVPSQYINPMTMHPGSVTKEIYEEDYVPKSQAYSQQAQYSPYQYGQETGGYQEGYEYQQGSDFTAADSMIEIAEQVFSEKVKSMQKKLDEFNEFKALTSTKVESVSERLKRIESTIDRLQSAILDRIGSYGSGLDSIKKEMTMMQDSFGKIVNTLADKREHQGHHAAQHITQHETPTHTVHKIHKTTTVVHKSQGPKRKKHSKK